MAQRPGEPGLADAFVVIMQYCKTKLRYMEYLKTCAAKAAAVALSRGANVFHTLEL